MDETAAEASALQAAEESLPPRRSGKGRAPRGEGGATRKRPAAARARSTRPAASSERRRPMQMSLWSIMSPNQVMSQGTRVGGVILLVLFAVGGLTLLYQLLSGSHFFALKGVEVEGNSLIPASEIEARVRSVAAPGVLKTELASIKKVLEQDPLIRSASIARLLPDRVRVTIQERQPVALAIKADGSIVCLDEDGKVFGSQAAWRGKAVPPVLRGLAAEGGERAAESNRQLITIYRTLLADLDQNEPPLSSRIDTVEYFDDRGVQVTLVDRKIIVLLGKGDYRTRLNVALDILEEAKKGDAESLKVLRIADAERLINGSARIVYLNVTDPNRAIVGLDE